MDLEQSLCWLSLAQQPYPLINEFLKQLSDSENDVISLINHWLKTNHCTINHSQLEQSLDWLQQPDHHLYCFPQYPERLKTINDPPAILFLAGNPELLFFDQIAIVGSRKPSCGGRENAVLFSGSLADAGLTIVSGLATGIDGIAHQAALDVKGLTTAVLGCGHKTCYPAKHQHLFETTKENGLIISEFTPDTPVRAQQFPRRNRIISGLSLGVLVIEAAIKSGSLITCRLAATQGREVFAVPGDITNPMSQGCHHLIREGATLVEKPNDILQELNFVPRKSSLSTADIFTSSAETSNNLTTDEKTLLLCINRHPTSLDKILNRSTMNMTEVLSVLFKLEMKKMVMVTADGYYKSAINHQ